ncbi:hypothetical protein Tco_0230478, partial [Tanacetum coccineum]
IKHLKAQIKKLKKQAKHVIAHHEAWVKSASLKERLAAKKSLKKQWMQKEYVSKQGRKPTKAEPSVHKSPAFDELTDDTMDYMESKNAQDVGRTRSRVSEEKETADDEVSTEDVLSTAILGKDYSNLLIADSLLKTIRFINAPCYGNEALDSPKANELTIPEQTATGKGISNSFMAGSLPKTTKPT